MKGVKRCLLVFLVVFVAIACSPMENGLRRSSNLNRIETHGVLRVGTAADMPPLTMLNKSGHPMGLDVDLAGTIAKAMGVELKLVIIPFPDLLPALAAGDVDMVVSGMTITPERNLAAAFVGPYHVTGKALLTKFKSMVASEDMSKLDSAALAFTALEGSTSASLVETKMPEARLVTAKTYAEAVDRVLTNKVDAMVADYAACVLALLKHPHAGLVSRITPFTYEPLGIAIPPGDAQMINWLTNFLDTLRETDALVKLNAKWFENPSWLPELMEPQVKNTP